MAVWTYRLVRNKRFPDPGRELFILSEKLESAGPVEEIEIKLADRKGPPGKGARPGELFLFVVGHESEFRVKAIGVAGGEYREGPVLPGLRDLYGDAEGNWLSLSRLVFLGEPAAPESLGLSREDIPKVRAAVKKISSATHLNDQAWEIVGVPRSMSQ